MHRALPWRPGGFKVDIDKTVRTYLPEFEIGDKEAAAAIAVRQLLNHTAGFEGDIFTDTGVGEDAAQKYLEVIHDIPQLFAPGEQFSYNNAGYCVLRRLVEVLCEKSYDAFLRDHLLTPLGLTHSAIGPYEAILFRAAVSQIPSDVEGTLAPAPMWALCAPTDRRARCSRCGPATSCPSAPCT